MVTWGTCRVLGLEQKGRAVRTGRPRVRSPTQPQRLTVQTALSRGTRWAFWVIPEPHLVGRKSSVVRVPGKQMAASGRTSHPFSRHVSVYSVPRLCSGHWGFVHHTRNSVSMLPWSLGLSEADKQEQELREAWGIWSSHPLL